MAKTKLKKESSATTKIKELTGIKPSKVNKEHLGKMQEIVSNINKIYLELGRLSANNHSYLHELAGNQDKLTLLQEDLKTEYHFNMRNKHMEYLDLKKDFNTVVTCINNLFQGDPKNEYIKKTLQRVGIIPKGDIH